MQKEYKNDLSIPKDVKRGFPLLKISHFDVNFDDLFLPKTVKNQLEHIIQEFKYADVFTNYNLDYKKKILLYGKSGTGKTFSVQAISSILHIPVVYVNFNNIISFCLDETINNLYKVFNFIRDKTWIVLFNEFNVINKDKTYFYGCNEIKYTVNSFLQMLNTVKGYNLLFVETDCQNILNSIIEKHFDTIINYKLPDKTTQKMLFKHYLKPLKRDKNIDLDRVTTQSKNLSPADIKTVIIDSLKSIIIDHRNVLKEDDLISTIIQFQHLKQNNIKL